MRIKITPDVKKTAFTAPDMLEALRMLMPQEPREADSYDRAMWKNARAAIAKATGKGDA
jgi:hypothetical protein